MSIEMQDSSIIQTPESKDTKPILPPEFFLKEIDDPNKVTCGIPTTEVALWQRRYIATQRYLEEGYLTENDPHLKDGVYLDKYEDHAIPFLAMVGPDPVASLRLIPNKPNGLPINNEEEIEVDFIWKNKMSQIPYEVSQLAILKGKSSTLKPTLGLLRQFVAYTRAQGHDEAAAVVDNRVYKYLNGSYINFNLPYVGPPVTYMGSASIPVYINITNAIKSCREAGNKPLADFLDTGKAAGFEWYQGI